MQREEESKMWAPPKDRKGDEKKSKGLGQEPEKQRRRLWKHIRDKRKTSFSKCDNIIQKRKILTPSGAPQCLKPAEQYQTPGYFIPTSVFHTCTTAINICAIHFCKKKMFCLFSKRKYQNMLKAINLTIWKAEVKLHNKLDLFYKFFL